MLSFLIDTTTLYANLKSLGINADSLLYLIISYIFYKKLDHKIDKEVKSIYKHINVEIGKLKSEIKGLRSEISKIKLDLGQLKFAVFEIQTIMRDKFNIQVNQDINHYGQANSPLVLKPEFHKYLVATSLKQQIDSNIDKIKELVELKKTQTGLDAQETINNLVIFGDLNKLLDLKQFKQMLYEDGKTTIDAHSILSLYLYEKIIPDIFKSCSQQSSIK